MGGIASGAVRRKKAAMRDYAQFILGIKRKVSDKTLQQLREMGISEEEGHRPDACADEDNGQGDCGRY